MDRLGYGCWLVLIPHTQDRRYTSRKREVERCVCFCCNGIGQRQNIQSSVHRCCMQKKDIKRIFNIIDNIAGNCKWEMDEELRAICREAVQTDYITFDDTGNVFYKQHFVTTLNNWEDNGAWKNRRLTGSKTLSSLVRFYSGMMHTLLRAGEIVLPDKQLVIMAAIENLDIVPSNPTLAAAIVVGYKWKDDDELEKLPREIRKLIKFYFVPETTRRDVKP